MQPTGSKRHWRMEFVEWLPWSTTQLCGNTYRLKTALVLTIRCSQQDKPQLLPIRLFGSGSSRVEMPPKSAYEFGPTGKTDSSLDPAFTGKRCIGSATKVKCCGVIFLRRRRRKASQTVRKEPPFCCCTMQRGITTERRLELQPNRSVLCFG